MMPSQAAPRTGFKFVLTVKAGPDKGVSYQLLPPRVMIGRGADTNVTLSDPRVSRQAILIEFSMEKIVATDLSMRDSMAVNGRVTKEASIKNGDTLIVGDTELVFVVEALQLSSEGGRTPALRPQGPRPPGDVVSFPGQSQRGGFPPPRGNSGYTSQAPRAPAGQDSGRVRFYVIVAVVLGGFAWFVSAGGGSQTTEPTIKTLDQLEKDLKSTEERVEEIEKKRHFASEEERTRYEEAQKHYLEGFRDYQKGQWARAFKSFETARAIDPDHQMARRYSKLAEKQRDEMVALLTIEGRRYKEKHMFARCVSAFGKVLESLPNKDELKYKQAEALRKECELLVGERFR